jgi:metallophosphoesterase superfamily enzyme
MLVINDLHIGAIRSAGTTPSSALALRRYALDSFSSLLDHTNEDLVILGDLLDAHSIPMQDLLETYLMLNKWLEKGHCLHLIPGNHDVSTDSSKLSSFQFLGKLLIDHPTVQYLQGGGWIDEEDGIYAVSHVPNQDLFDMELAKVPECKFLLVHCNYDNHFAKDSDHSLNLSEEQAKVSKAGTIVFAHEHAPRKLLGGKVVVMGNQFPMSISDCLDGHDKFMHQIAGDKINPIKVWDRKTEYVEMDWRSPEPTDAKFIRFIGTASAEESAAAADTVARYRKASEAYVVGNGIRVQTSEGQKQLEIESLEQVRAFDVMAALKDYLTEKEYGKLQSLAQQ